MNNHKPQPKKTSLPPRRSNMPITIMHRVELVLAMILFGFFKILGVGISSWVAGKTLRFCGPLLRKIHHRGVDNLKRVYPDWSPIQIRQTLGNVWENLGRTGAEFSHLDKFSPYWDENSMNGKIKHLIETHKITPEQAQLVQNLTPSTSNKRVEIEMSHDLIIAIATGEPVIFVTGHFANWEIMSVMCNYLNMECAIVYRATNNPLMDELIIKTRGKSVSHRHIPKGPDGARAFIDALKDKCSIALLMDQKHNSGVKAPFMGHDAMTAPTAARMALNIGHTIIPVSVTRKKGTHFTMIAHEKIRYTKTINRNQDILAITTLINQALEQIIRKQPGQWLWFHRRWPKE